MSQALGRRSYSTTLAKRLGGGSNSCGFAPNLHLALPGIYRPSVRASTGAGVAAGGAQNSRSLQFCAAWQSSAQAADAAA